MRRILVDHAHARLADKRGGEFERVKLVGDEATESPRIDVLALHESLQRVAAVNPRQERIVELQYFEGKPGLGATEPVATFAVPYRSTRPAECPSSTEM